MTLRSSRCLWSVGRSGFRRLSGVSGVAAGEGDPAPSGRALATFAKAAVGIFAVGGSGLGLWLLPDSADAPFVNSSDPRLNGCSEPAEDKIPRFLFGGSFRRRVFFKYEKRLRLQSSPEKEPIPAGSGISEKMKALLDDTENPSLYQFDFPHETFTSRINHATIPASFHFWLLLVNVLIFEYFASIRSPEGEVFMSPADLMRAVVPVFPSSESSIVKEGCLRGEWKPGVLHCASSPLFLLFDTNNDGLISFPEYIFFVTLLSIPDSSFSVAFKMFDLDNNGSIERDEFKNVMALMRSYNRQGACHRNGLRIGLKIRGSVENAGLVEYFFGKDGNERLQHDKFVKFLRDLHDEILRLEFDHYDVKSEGAISAKDFALSMVASADINHINKFLDRVDVLDKNLNLKDMRITFEEFKAFADLRKRLDLLSFAICSYGKANGFLAKEDFIRAASHVCGISLSDNVVDIVFHVFDSNNDGHLSSEEFLRVMQKREIDIRQPTSASRFRHSFMLP